jgi:hypothetical protein
MAKADHRNNAKLRTPCDVAAMLDPGSGRIFAIANRRDKARRVLDGAELVDVTAG